MSEPKDEELLVAYTGQGPKAGPTDVSDYDVFLKTFGSPNLDLSQEHRVDDIQEQIRVSRVFEQQIQKPVDRYEKLPRKKMRSKYSRKRGKRK